MLRPHDVVNFMYPFVDRNVHFVYPYGATLTVQKPSVAVLSTGSACLPLSRPVCAFRSFVKVSLHVQSCITAALLMNIHVMWYESGLWCKLVYCT